MKARTDLEDEAGAYGRQHQEEWARGSSSRGHAVGSMVGHWASVTLEWALTGLDQEMIDDRSSSSSSHAFGAGDKYARGLPKPAIHKTTWRVDRSGFGFGLLLARQTKGVALPAPSKKEEQARSHAARLALFSLSPKKRKKKPSRAGSKTVQTSHAGLRSKLLPWPLCHACEEEEERLPSRCIVCTMTALPSFSFAPSPSLPAAERATPHRLLLWGCLMRAFFVATPTLTPHTHIMRTTQAHDPSKQARSYHHGAGLDAPDGGAHLRRAHQLPAHRPGPCVCVLARSACVRAPPSPPSTSAPTPRHTLHFTHTTRCWT